MRIKYVLRSGVLGATLGFFPPFLATGFGIKNACAPSDNADFSNANVTAAANQCLDNKFQSVGFGTSDFFVNSIFNIPSVIGLVVGFAIGVGVGIKKEMKRDADSERLSLLSIHAPDAPVSIVSLNPSSQFSGNNPRNANRSAGYNALQEVEVPTIGSVNP